MNTLKVGLLLAAITALLVFTGHMLGGSAGVILALLLSVAMNLGTFWFSDKIVLAMTGAQRLSPSQAPELFQMVERLAARDEIPTPRLYLVPDPSPNAFATGRDPAHGVVAVNQGLLDLLSPQEVKGVIAHEIAHIKFRDTLTMAIVATMAGAISSIGNIFMFRSLFGGSEEEGGLLEGLVAMLVAPLAATMIQLGISRAREFEADRYGALIAGTHTGLRNALLKLNKGVSLTPGNVPASAAHMCIVNPFSGLSGVAKLFSTHPPVEERIRRLDSLNLKEVA